MTSASLCVDGYGAVILPGQRFQPIGASPCTQCVCSSGKGEHCVSVFCQPPANCAKSAILHKKGNCCEFICLDQPSFPLLQMAASGQIESIAVQSPTANQSTAGDSSLAGLSASNGAVSLTPSTVAGTSASSAKSPTIDKHRTVAFNGPSMVKLQLNNYALGLNGLADSSSGGSGTAETNAKSRTIAALSSQYVNGIQKSSLPAAYTPERKQPYGHGLLPAYIYGQFPLNASSAHLNELMHLNEHRLHERRQNDRRVPGSSSIVSSSIQSGTIGGGGAGSTNNNGRSLVIDEVSPARLANSHQLGVRLIASSITSFLILTLLLFLIHRLRQRRLLAMIRSKC